MLAAAETEVLIPGHGELWAGPVEQAAGAALAAGQARVRLRGQYQGKTIAITGAARGSGLLRRRRCC